MVEEKVKNDVVNVAPVDEPMSLGKAWIFSIQHVFAMCAGAVAVPIIVGGAAGLSPAEIVFLINAGLFMAGIATLIQSAGVKGYLGAKIPVIEGTSFAAVAAMAAIAATYKGNSTLAMTTIYGAVIAAGLVGIVLAPLFGKLIRFFPKVVTGTVVLTIGISLLPTAVKWITNSAVKPAAPSQLYLALSVLGITLLLFKFLKGIWNSAAILFGLVLGTILAAMFGMVDFKPVMQAGWFSVNMPLHFGAPRFDPSAIISIGLVMLVLMTESTGNMMAVHEMVDKPVEGKNITRGLMADSISTLLAGIFNSFPQTPFAQNVGLVSLTGIKSRFVAIYAGAILLVLSFIPKFGALIVAIPKPVLGGVGFAMFGMVLVGGIRTLGKVQYDGTKNAVIVAVSIGLAMIPVANDGFYHNFPNWVQTIFHSGITTGSLAAVLLNIFFNEIGKKENKQA
ncbi:nucleobase:cation symporter-2 family protein [Clostridium sp. OS1-26]|uniref:nucleobase:cation symporter-2 family protein n=1 Tax=Clostridium sp. OS1-26 TaxID=3070681 RepID=UPI0027DF60C8|nr:nucleobase:cation symporter-2 family protein [Clostridium sp. OS1-26]WML36366.1 nucleobase:cation symporter-2 family protein [Clostridium sp. OS1-26]